MVCLGLAACRSAAPAIQPVSISSPLQTTTPVTAPAATIAPLPTTLPAAVSTVAAAPIYLQALTWNSEPVVPIILYHRFIPDFNKESSKTKLRLGDFRQQLQSLYDSGYSLIPLEHWLKGDLSVSPGRRPLILTMDDAFFADQIFLDPNGTPSSKSGIGVLWQFTQDHPDFGFSAALFSNLGDKLYANQDNGTHFTNEGIWKPALADVIVWGIQHDVMPYNHLYTHPRLDLTEGKFINSEILTNDTSLARLLKLANHTDLLTRVDNIIALPYSIWPPSPGGKKLITNYHNPQGQPVLAVLEAGYYHDEHTLTYSPFSPHFDRYHIPRITMNTQKSVDYLVDNRQQIPIAQKCQLGPVDSARTNESSYLSGLINNAIQSGACQPGFYQVNNLYFDASRSNIIQAQLPPIGQ
jgi:hypothetical protein